MKLKRQISTLIVIMIVLAAVLTGCGGSTSPETGSSDEPKKEEVKALELSASSGGMAASSPAGKAMDFFAEKIAEYSNGTVTVKVFYDSSLGDPTSVVQGMQKGAVDIAATGDSYFSGLVPEIQVFELPFLFDSYETARGAVDGPVGQKVMAKFDGKGIKPLAFWEIGFRHLTNSVRHVKTPDDLQGIKIRTLPAQIQVKTWEQLGALPTPIDFSELYTSLQQGVVDAQENPVNLIRTSKFYEVQKYLSLTGHVYTPMFLAMSQNTWDKLNAEQQDAVMKAAQDAQEYERGLVKDGESDDLAFIEQQGVTVERTPEIAKFKEIATQTYSMFTEKYGDELLNELLGK
ncbi:MAG: DctP family TRAP transporter solute-binding subunit [Peptococcaceae bacterium]